MSPGTELIDLDAVILWGKESGHLRLYVCHGVVEDMNIRSENGGHGVEC